MVDAKGNLATFTGKGCILWAGGVTGKRYAAQGNILAPPMEEPRPHYFVPVIQHLAACVREGRLPIVKFREMLNVQRIMDGIMESARTGREVKFASANG